MELVYSNYGETNTIHLGRLKEEDVLDVMDTKYQNKTWRDKKGHIEYKESCWCPKSMVLQFWKTAWSYASKDYRRSAHTWKLCKLVNDASSLQNHK